MSENSTNVNEQSEESAASENPPVSEKESTPKKESVFLRINGGRIKTAITQLSDEKKLPEFGVGDVVKVHYKIKEGDKERVQVYEGTVIAIRGEGPGRTFNVRRISHDVGVERIFPFFSPAIAKIDVIRRGKVRRAKLFFLRHKSGKEGRIKELFTADVRKKMKSKAEAKEKKKVKVETKS